jgi:ribosomal protein S18 acetylase RimI-like enzyme
MGICIRRGFQDCGLGAALMDRLGAIARDVGPPVMGLTVQQANPRGIALYQKMGFGVVREQVRPGDGEPEFYMERRVR